MITKFIFSKWCVDKSVVKVMASEMTKDQNAFYNDSSWIYHVHMQELVCFFRFVNDF